MERDSISSKDCDETFPPLPRAAQTRPHALSSQFGADADLVAKKTGLSRESIFRIERGEQVKLTTLRKIATALQGSPSQWADLLAAWLRFQAGQHAKLVSIESLKPASSLKEDSDAWATKVLELISRLPAAERKNILFALENPQIIQCLTHIRKTLTSPTRQSPSADTPPSTRPPIPLPQQLRSPTPISKLYFQGR